MNLVAVDARSRHTAMTTETAREVCYVYQTGRMKAPAVRPRAIVSLAPGGRRRG